MTEELLRRWVRGELPPDRRREVSRWIVGCSAPELGPLLLGMAREHRHQQADQALAARGGLWVRLVEAWDNLLDLGRAELAGDDAGLVLASADEVPDRPEVELEQDGDDLRLRVAVEAGEVAVYITADTGRAECLVAPQPPATVIWPLRFRDAEGRPTVWVAWGPVVPSREDPLEALDASLSDASVTVRALRWEA